MPARPRLLGLLAVAIVLTACPSQAPTPSPAGPTQTPSPSPSISRSPGSAEPMPTAEDIATLVAAGDIADCGRDADSMTGALVAELDGTVATLGDNVYPAGSDDRYATCYDEAWGAAIDRTRPSIGNHDLAEDGGAAYHRYFGEAAGEAGEGWYSYELGVWHVVVLNSNCQFVGCAPRSAQHDWLLADLAASDAECTLAYWHHPRFSSGPHGDDPAVASFWEALDEADADLVLAGHEHQYERFQPQAADGVTDPDGLRQITVGTGGAALRPAVRVAPNSELIIDDAFGVIVLTLRPGGYEWRLLAIDGAERDSGSASCQ